MNMTFTPGTWHPSLTPFLLTRYVLGASCEPSTILRARNLKLRKRRSPPAGIAPPHRKTDLSRQRLKYSEVSGTSRKGAQPNPSPSLPGEEDLKCTCTNPWIQAGQEGRRGRRAGAQHARPRRGMCCESGVSSLRLGRWSEATRNMAKAAGRGRRTENAVP